MMKSQRTKKFLSRREFLRDTALVVAAIGAGTLGRGFQAAHASDAGGPLLFAQSGPGELYAGNWKTWVLRSGREIGVPRPEAATSAQGTRELAQLKRAQAERTETQINAARFWDTGTATRRWTEIHLEMIKSHRPNPPRAARGLALMHLAMYDAMVAAWHIKYLYNHPAPNGVDATLMPVVRPRDNPSYPSEHAVAAGAASRVLSYLFPQQGSEWFEAKAQEAALSRLWAGADWPSAVEQGLALGRSVADRVLAHAGTDGSGTAWDGKRPTGACYWKPTPPGLVYPPLEPSWGKVKPWLLTSADQFRPGPPPRCGSAEEREQYMEFVSHGQQPDRRAEANRLLLERRSRHVHAARPLV